MQPIIKIENLSKQYRLGNVGTGTLSHDLNRWWANLRGKEDPFLKIGETNTQNAKGNSDYVWALKDINFEVMPGEVLGIIGKNGAGKSTLLKLLSRVTAPTTGSIKVRGHIASLLEVGTGFHPELTGRENIFLNGAILGMTSAEIRSKFDEIVDFAGVDRYIDTPVKRYSSGMYVRLAFAVAAHLDPEILVVDEVLAVGDAEFQKKAIGKMQDVSREEGRTVLFVSHNMAAIQSLCNIGMLLENGTIVKEGSSHDVVQSYFSMGLINKERPPIEKYRNYNIKAAPVFIKDIYVKGFQNEIPNIPMNQAPTIVINIIAKERIANANISLGFINAEGINTDMAFSWDDNFYLNLDEGNHNIEFSQKNFSLPPGKYTIGVGLNQSFNTIAWDGIRYYPIFEIENRNNVIHYNFRPWAIHHSQNNNWKSTKIV